MKSPIGLIAGAGRFPILFAQEAKRRGENVIAIGLKGVTSEQLAEVIGTVHTFKLGQVNGPIKVLKDAGVKRVVMAGKVQHTSLFGGIMPDLRAVKILATLKDRRTDTILAAIANEFTKEGMELISSATYLTHLLPAPGVLTGRVPTKSESEDMAFGLRAAKALSGFDIGQTVIVKDKAVVAVEAMEGTDATLLRAAELVRAYKKNTGLILIKVAKPKQDFRFDLPVLGLDTLKIMERVNVTAIAIEANKTLIFDKEDFLTEANKLKISIKAFKQEEIE